MSSRTANSSGRDGRTTRRRKSQELKALEKRLGCNASLLEQIPSTLDLEYYEGNLSLPCNQTALCASMLYIGTANTNERTVDVFAFLVKNNKVRRVEFSAYHADSQTYSSFCISEHWSTMLLRDEFKDKDFNQEHLAAVVKLVFIEKSNVEQPHIPFSENFLNDLTRACRRLQQAVKKADRPPESRPSSRSAATQSLSEQATYSSVGATKRRRLAQGTDRWADLRTALAEQKIAADEVASSNQQLGQIEQDISALQGERDQLLVVQEEQKEREAKTAARVEELWDEDEPIRKRSRV
ncbi:uncharacterized protein N0V89_005406 [Didymosphaeria variabile]|uniref:Uncharacterized protein n=1 Tax=Didymosphaeria variabile TaxID=1932322 RepID=A0A9W9CAF8_9PLEO|nr:uncharacterized protein N0V89_005406 [Didymosphaeria variabile]KAJ4353676.1 hypothetical protein N0V89_005406 [Didymosphaeria variabile]